MPIVYDFAPLEKMLQSLTKPDDDNLRTTQAELISDYRNYVELEVKDLVPQRPEVTFASMLRVNNVKVEVSSASDPGPVAEATSTYRSSLANVLSRVRRLAQPVRQARPLGRGPRLRPLGPLPGAGGYKYREDVVRALIEAEGGLERTEKLILEYKDILETIPK